MYETIEIVVRFSNTVSCCVSDDIVFVFLVLLGSCLGNLCLHARRGVVGQKHDRVQKPVRG